MMTHGQIWSAIDRLAARHGLSASGLARRAGLDPTALNPSKRQASDGRPRWPSTESLAKILDATGSDMGELVRLMGQGSPVGGRIPVIGYAQAGAAGYFDDAGYPAGAGWDEVEFPGLEDRGAYALEISGDSMEPVFRDGDVIIVSPAASIRRGDRIVVRTRSGEVMAKELARMTATRMELRSLNPAHPDRVVENAEVEWKARIVWASQ